MIIAWYLFSTSLIMNIIIIGYVILFQNPESNETNIYFSFSGVNEGAHNNVKTSIVVKLWAELILGG